MISELRRPFENYCEVQDAGDGKPLTLFLQAQIRRLFGEVLTDSSSFPIVDGKANGRRSISFELGSRLLELRFNLHSCFPPLAKGHVLDSSVSLLIPGAEALIPAEQAPEPDDAPYELTWMFLRAGEIARSEVHIAAMARFPDVIAAKPTYKVSQYFAGCGIGTALFGATAEQVMCAIEADPFQAFAGQDILLRVVDYSEYRGVSTGWTSSIAKDLGMRPNAVSEGDDQIWSMKIPGSGAPALIEC